MNATSSAATASSAPPRQAPRWQDVRARAIDATFDADRRRVGERVALVFRWLFLIVLGALNHLNPNTATEAKVIVDVVLFGWAVMKRHRAGGARPRLPARQAVQPDHDGPGHLLRRRTRVPVKRLQQPVLPRPVPGS